MAVQRNMWAIRSNAQVELAKGEGLHWHVPCYLMLVGSFWLLLLRQIIQDQCLECLLPPDSAVRVVCSTVPRGPVVLTRVAHSAQQAYQTCVPIPLTEQSPAPAVKSKLLASRLTSNNSVKVKQGGCHFSSPTSLCWLEASLHECRLHHCEFPITV